MTIIIPDDLTIAFRLRGHACRIVRVPPTWSWVGLIDGTLVAAAMDAGQVAAYIIAELIARGGARA